MQYSQLVFIARAGYDPIQTSKENWFGDEFERMFPPHTRLQLRKVNLVLQQKTGLLTPQLNEAGQNLSNRHH